MDSVLYSEVAEGFNVASDRSHLELNDIIDQDDTAAAMEILYWVSDVPGIVDNVMKGLGCSVKVGMEIMSVNVSTSCQQQALLGALDLLTQSDLRKKLPAFNTCFQDVSDAFISCTSYTGETTTTMDATIECCLQLEKVARDFSSLARTYGRVIISELHLPLEMKTIRPLNLGGVLGGTKYVVRGILFKIPSGEMFTAYPDPIHMANKVQGHELKGLKAYFGWFFNRGYVGMVSFPLAAVIDYKGYRILAMTQLPLDGSKSLIYGSADAGDECHVHNEEPSWSGLVRDASLGLNLKPHWVVNGRSSGDETEIASCVDLEGHRGLDKRFYLLDFSRTFPPAYRAEEHRRSFDKLWSYYHMLRQEFVSGWSTPLSADAFSPFQSCVSEGRREESKVCNREVRTATEHLESVTVAQVCKALMNATDWSVTLTHVFHRHGLNMRYLGLVYMRLLSSELYSRSYRHLYRSVLAEAMMRVLKKYLRWRLRLAAKRAQSSETEGDSELQQEAVTVLNNFFGLSPDYSTWAEKKNTFVLESLQETFYFTKEHARQAVDTFLSDAKMEEVGSMGAQTSAVTIKYVVLTRLNDAVDLGIPRSILSELRVAVEMGSHQEWHSFRLATIFEYSDLNFGERVKNLDIVERALGLSQFLKGTTANIVISASGRLNYLVSSFETFESALEASPKDPWLNLLMADVCQSIWKLVSSEKGAVEVATRSRERALVHYKLAATGSNVRAYRNYGHFLLSLDMVSEAEMCFLNALESCERLSTAPDESSLTALVRILERKGETQLAVSLKERAKSWFSIRDNWISINSRSTKHKQQAESPLSPRRGQVELRKGTIRLGQSRTSGVSPETKGPSCLQVVQTESGTLEKESSVLSRGSVGDRSASKLKKIGETLRLRVKNARGGVSPPSSARNSCASTIDESALSVCGNVMEKEEEETALLNKGQTELMAALERNRVLLDKLKQME